MRCAVFGCNADNQAKNYDGSLKFFRFPLKESLLKAWKNACGRKDKISATNARICSQHFIDSDFERNLQQELLGFKAKGQRVIKPEAIPTRNLPKNMHDKVIPSTSGVTSRTRRLEKRKQFSLVAEILQEHVTQTESCGNGFADELADNGEGVDNNLEAENVQVSYKNMGTNTDIDDRDNTIAELKNKIAQLETRVETEAKAMNSLFSVGQLKKLQNPQVRPRWSLEEIAKAIVIHSAGPRAYRLLLKKGYPFPAVSTLRSWLKKINISPGILKPVFNIIKQKDMNKMQKVCVLSFDEIKVRKLYLYDKANDETLKPYSYVQVAMIRGLFSNWKQPVFYDYDCKMTKTILYEIINYVEKSGFQIVALVSDLGGGNRSLHNELEITTEKTWFTNPANGHKIYVFADVPHLTKLIRNHFVDSGLIVNGKEINKSIVEKVLELTSGSDLTIAHKITKETLNVKNAGRQKVKLATKLFSHTISCAITRCGMNGKLDQENNWIECAEFFKLVNDWFDCLNVRVPQSDGRDRMKAFGLSLDIQKGIIDKMTDVMKNLRVKGKKSILPFQTEIIGILITNNSLPLLFEDLKERFGCTYILTYRLNQDVLENFFGTIRAKGGLHDHPDPLEFRYRLRSYILGRNEGSLSAYGNVEEDRTPDLCPEEFNLSVQCFRGLEVTDDSVQQTDNEDAELEELVYDGLENLAGFICKKLKEPSSTLARCSESSFSWVDHLNEGGLIKPSDEFMTQMELLEGIFTKINAQEILITKNYLQKLMLESSNVCCSNKTKKLFFRSRMFFRLRHLNKELHNNTLSRKRKIKKTIK